MSWPLAMIVALALDAAIGWPDPVFRRIGHPVTWIGALIAALEGRMNRADRPAAARFAAGLTAFVIVLTATLACTLLIALLLPGGWLGTVLTGVLAWPLVAARSLQVHVADVARPLEAQDLAGGRAAVARIVGRDPARLDRPGVIRAALESLAENASDGVVAPLFWGALLGLPGIALYKAINTMDSMIGHRSDRYEMYGKAAARLDDAVNWIPARLTGALLALCSQRASSAWATIRRDARHHRSPNAGWPEAALAGALHLRLSGPRTYGDKVSDEPWVNPEGLDPVPADIGQALALYRRALLALTALLGLWALI